MIPYFQFNTINFGPITIQVWGLVVSLGFLVGLWLVNRLAKKSFLSTNMMLDLAFWSLLGGIIGARIFHVVFYEPMYYRGHLQEALQFWQGGASSLGGFAGVAVSIGLYLKLKKITLKEFLPYFDIGTAGLWLGWAIGRIGCFLIHDHPGRLTNFWLAVNFPYGARFDLGLMDSILALLIFLGFFPFFKRIIKYRSGLFAIITISTYAFGRFWLDFLRATDVSYADARYWHLTPAQWGMMGALFIALTYLLLFAKIKHNTKLKGGYAKCEESQNKK